MNAKEQSVRHLATLYTVVIGVAVPSSIYQLLGGENPDQINIDWDGTFLLFLAFLLTVFPFYHGAMRHLDDTYLANNAAEVGPFGLLLDVFLLFTHGVLFVVLSLLLTRPENFLLILAITLALDVSWALLAHYAFSVDRTNKPELSWATINVGAVALLLALTCADHTFGLSQQVLSSAILAIAALRTIIDYGKNRSFYTPD